MKLRAKQTLRMIAQVLDIFESPAKVHKGMATWFTSIPNRTKPIRLVMTNIENNWVPMLVCDYCGKGPIDAMSDDSCCIIYGTIKSPNA